MGDENRVSGWPCQLENTGCFHLVKRRVDTARLGLEGFQNCSALGLCSKPVRLIAITSRGKKDKLDKLPNHKMCIQHVHQGLLSSSQILQFL